MEGWILGGPKQQMAIVIKLTRKSSYTKKRERCKIKPCRTPTFKGKVHEEEYTEHILRSNQK